MVVSGFGALGARPLLEGRGDDLRVRSSVLVLQQIADLRAALSAWQVYVQPYFTDFSVKAVQVGATEVATAAGLAHTAASAAASVVKSLRSEGLVVRAHELESANAIFTRAIGAFAPIIAGAEATVVERTVKAENDAYAADARGHGARRRRPAGQERSRSRRVDRTARRRPEGASPRRWNRCVGDSRRDRRRRRNARAGKSGSVGERPNARRTKPLCRTRSDMAKTEADAYALMAVAFTQTVPGLQVEMLIADSSRAHFHRTLTTEAAGSPLAAQRLRGRVALRLSGDATRPYVVVPDESRPQRLSLREGPAIG